MDDSSTDDDTASQTTEDDPQIPQHQAPPPPSQPAAPPPPPAVGVVPRERPHYSLRHTLRGHNQSISAVKFSPDGKLLASCGVSPLLDFVVLAINVSIIYRLMIHTSRRRESGQNMVS